MRPCAQEGPARGGERLGGGGGGGGELRGAAVHGQGMSGHAQLGKYTVTEKLAFITQQSASGQALFAVVSRTKDVCGVQNHRCQTESCDIDQGIARAHVVVGYAEAEEELPHAQT